MSPLVGEIKRGWSTSYIESLKSDRAIISRIKENSDKIRVDVEHASFQPDLRTLLSRYDNRQL